MHSKKKKISNLFVFFSNTIYESTHDTKISDIDECEINKIRN